MIIMKRLSIIIIVFIVIQMFCTNICMAADVLDPNKWDPSKQESSVIAPDDDQQFIKKVDVILSTIRNIGIVVSVGALMIIGIRFMTGSIEEKAEFKQVMPGYIIGAILVFSVSVLPNLIFNIVQNF